MTDSGFMLFLKNHVGATALVVMALAVHFNWWRSGKYAGQRGKRILIGLLAALVWIAYLLEAQSVSGLLPLEVFVTLHMAGLAWSLVSLAVFAAQQVDGLLLRVLKGVFRPAPAAPGFETVESPGRRRLLQTVRGAVYATPALALGYGTFVERENFRLEEIEIGIAGLPKELEGLRIVQITDIHMGAFLSQRELERIIGMANETKAHLAIMTGDLVTRVGDPLDACLEQLARVKTDAGMIGCLGNHEIYAKAQDYVERKGARLGIQFLRSEKRMMEFRGQKINFAGVDYQRRGAPYLVGAESLIEPGVTNILLSHNPDVFPVAAAQGYGLTLAGHTHGGQITVEYLQQFVNPARFVTRFVSGLYTEGNKKIYVSRGLGTVGVPTRIGAPPELTVIRLSAV